jgi:hypothetical protein
MTEDEVIAVLGQPGGKDVRPEGAIWVYDCSPCWRSWVSVHFDKDGRVLHAFILD